MKTKQIKAVAAWANSHTAFFNPSPLIKATGLSKVHILPADADSYERMVEQMARAIYPNLVPIPKVSWVKAWADDKQWLRHVARAALRAIGITAPKRGKKGQKPTPLNEGDHCPSRNQGQGD